MHRFFVAVNYTNILTALFIFSFRDGRHTSRCNFSACASHPPSCTCTQIYREISDISILLSHSFSFSTPFFIQKYSYGYVMRTACNFEYSILAQLLDYTHQKEQILTSRSCFEIQDIFRYQINAIRIVSLMARCTIKVLISPIILRMFSLPEMHCFKKFGMFEIKSSVSKVLRLIEPY